MSSYHRIFIRVFRDFKLYLYFVKDKKILSKKKLFQNYFVSKNILSLFFYYFYKKDLLFLVHVQLSGF